MYLGLPQELLICIHLLLMSGSEITSSRLQSLRFAALSGGLQILVDGHGEPSGFIAWASVNKDSLTAFLKFKTTPKYYWEFSEGNIAYVTDLHSINFWAASTKKQIKNILRTKRAVFYSRGTRSRLLIRKTGYFKIYDFQI